MPQPDPAASIAFDRAADYYDATRGFPPSVEERVADLFVRAGALGTQSRVLELGIGTGRIAVPLAARIGRYTGMDLSGPMLAKLVAKRGSLPLDVVRADATRPPFADGRFDAVVAVHVFHLIPGFREVLARLAHALRPGGLLLHGGDDHSHGEAWLRWRREVEGRYGVENVGVPRTEVETFPEREGWRAAGVHRIEFTRRIRPRAMLALVSGRAWSMTWRMSDADLAASVDALREDLLAAYGDLDREIELASGFWVRAYQSPEA
jgi:SAM-dependent methyltransferase